METDRERHRIVLMQALARLDQAAARLDAARQLTVSPDAGRQVVDASAIVHDLVIRIKVELQAKK